MPKSRGVSCPPPEPPVPIVLHRGSACLPSSTCFLCFRKTQKEITSKKRKSSPEGGFARVGSSLNHGRRNRGPLPPPPDFGRSHSILKFGHSEKKIFLVVLTNQRIYLKNVKTMRKIFSNYVCFSKSPNFNKIRYSIFKNNEILSIHTTKSDRIFHYIYMYFTQID